jgi:hypothetical protein
MPLHLMMLRLQQLSDLSLQIGQQHCYSELGNNAIRLKPLDTLVPKPDRCFCARGLQFPFLIRHTLCRIRYRDVISKHRNSSCSFTPEARTLPGRVRSGLRHRARPALEIRVWQGTDEASDPREDAGPTCGRTGRILPARPHARHLAAAPIATRPESSRRSPAGHRVPEPACRHRRAAAGGGALHRPRHSVRKADRRSCGKQGRDPRHHRAVTRRPEAALSGAPQPLFRYPL